MYILLTVFVFARLIHGYQTEDCIYSQSYWLSNASEPWPKASLLNQPLCGVSWYQLMHLNTSQTREASSMHWLLAFHQVCTALLNVKLQESVTPSTSKLPSSVILSVDVLFDSMQRYCDDLNGWIITLRVDTVLQRNLETLIRYNHGNRVCQPVSFSFTQEPQLFFLDYNDTEQGEMMRQASIMKHLYSVQWWLTVFSCLAVFLVIPSLVIYIVMIRNERREYSFFRTAIEPETYNVSSGEHNMEELSYSEEMLDSQQEYKEKQI